MKILLRIMHRAFNWLYAELLKLEEEIKGHEEEQVRVLVGPVKSNTYIPHSEPCKKRRDFCKTKLYEQLSRSLGYH